MTPNTRYLAALSSRGVPARTARARHAALVRLARNVAPRATSVGAFLRRVDRAVRP